MRRETTTYQVAEEGTYEITTEQAREFDRAFYRWQRKRIKEGTLTVPPLNDWHYAQRNYAEAAQ